jgi:phthalate 4,5-cis-dihydrodiol dehydrogenase
LGRAFTVMLPALAGDRRVALVAAADPLPEPRERFARDFGGRAYATAEELAADPEVEAIYLATPHQHRSSHAAAAARHGKHLLVEKPLATALPEGIAMIEAARRAGVQMVVGHSHSFDAPYRRARAIVESGAVGAPRMITALNFTDFLYRPRRPDELDTAQGGGVVFSQAAHQIDILRLLGGGMVKSVRAMTGRWDAARPTEGAYAALLSFADGTFATAVYSGYAHFDTDEFAGWIGEMGQRKDPAAYGAMRRLLKAAPSPQDEAALKAARNYGGAAFRPPDRAGVLHQHFGEVIVSCERADLRPLPTGVMIYGDGEARLDPLPPPATPRAEVIDELYAAVVHGRPPLHGGAWALATLEVCLAILQSARAGREVELRHQVPAAGP